MKYAVISGTGNYLPEREMSNVELESTLDTTHEWIVARTGITGRRIAAEHETTSYMASKAAAQALEASGLEADAIDMIVVATCTPEHFFPSMANHVQHALKISKAIPSFDVSAACSGFIYAMDVARQYITTGSARNVIVVGSEVMSRAVDWSDRSSCILFGDGAGAVVLSASDTPGILGSVLHASYDNDKLLTYPNFTKDGKRPLVGMKGHEVFKLAVKAMGEIVDEVLDKCGLHSDDIDWLIPHQANIRIINALGKKLSLPTERVIVTIEHQGNTSAASIPLALDFSIRSGRIKRGETLLLEAFGGGMTWGATIVRY